MKHVLCPNCLHRTLLVTNLPVPYADEDGQPIDPPTEGDLEYKCNGCGHETMSPATLSADQIPGILEELEVLLEVDEDVELGEREREAFGQLIDTIDRQTD